MHIHTDRQTEGDLQCAQSLGIWLGAARNTDKYTQPSSKTLAQRFQSILQLSTRRKAENRHARLKLTSL